MAASTRPRGLILRGHAWFYDIVIALMGLAYGRTHVRALLEVASLRPGEQVLDVGCGTGALALAAAKQLATGDGVTGVDASEQMIAVARRKAATTRLSVHFTVGTVEALPFDPAQFDVVFSTLMLHHLPKPARENCLREVRRVLKPAGRLIVADFEAPARKQRGIAARLHRHGGVPAHEVAALLERSGFLISRTGELGVGDIHFTIATPGTSL